MVDVKQQAGKAAPNAGYPGQQAKPASGAGRAAPKAGQGQSVGQTGQARPKAKQAAQQATPKARQKTAQQAGPEHTGDSNMLAAVAYVSNLFIPLVIPVILYILKEDDRFVRFHALQALVLEVVVLVAGMLIGSIGFIFLAVITLLTFGLGMFIMMPFILFAGLGILALLLFLAYKAYNWEYYKLPIIGDFCEKYV